MVNKKILRYFAIGVLTVPALSFVPLFMSSCDSNLSHFIEPTPEELYKTAEEGIAEYSLSLRNKKTSGNIVISFKSHTDNVIVMSMSEPVIDPSTYSELTFKVCFDFEVAPTNNDLTQDVDFACEFQSLDANGNLEWKQSIDGFGCLWDKKPWPRRTSLWGQNIVFAGKRFSDTLSYDLSQSWRPNVSWKLTDTSGGEIDFARTDQVLPTVCNGEIDPGVPVGTQMKLTADVPEIDFHGEHIITIGLKGPSKFHRLSSAILVDDGQNYQAVYSGFEGHITEETLNNLTITAKSTNPDITFTCTLEKEQQETNNNATEEKYKLIVKCPKNKITTKEDFWFDLSIKTGNVELLASPNPYLFSFPIQGTDGDDPGRTFIISQPYLWSSSDEMVNQQVVSDIVECDETIDTGSNRIKIESILITNIDTEKTYETEDSHYDQSIDKFVWDTFLFMNKKGPQDTRCRLKIETNISYFLKNSEEQHNQNFTFNYVPPFDDLRPKDNEIKLNVKKNADNQYTVSGKTELIVDDNAISHTDSATVGNIYLYPADDDTKCNEELEGYIYADGFDNARWYFDIQREFVVEDLDPAKDYLINITGEGGSWTVEMFRIPVKFNILN